MDDSMENQAKVWMTLTTPTAASEPPARRSWPCRKAAWARHRRVLATATS
jgi:hypothetical protein